MDKLFIKYFRDKYPWTKDTPVEYCPWYKRDLEVWEACKLAHGVEVLSDCKQEIDDRLEKACKETHEL